jgi:hypothetical protein
MIYQWVVYLHVLSVIVFFAAHGASMFVGFRIKKETDVTRLQAMLDVSSASVMTMVIALIVLQVAGIVAGFIGKWWSQGLWIWIALGLLLAVGVWMSIYSAMRYTPLRKVLGLPYQGAPKGEPLPEPGSAEEIAAAVDATNPVLLAVIGGAIPAFILWMMIFKPF